MWTKQLLHIIHLDFHHHNHHHHHYLIIIIIDQQNIHKVLSKVLRLLSTKVALSGQFIVLGLESLSPSSSLTSRSTSPSSSLSSSSSSTEKVKVRDNIRLIIQRIVIILCIIYLSYCQLVQSKLINQRKVENNPIDPMVFDTRQRLTSTNQHLIINSTTNKPKLCRYYPTTINKKSTIRPKKSNISSNQNSYHNEIELTSSLSLIATINKLSSPPISSSQLVKPNQLPINYDQNISNSVYLNSSNGLIPINSQLSPQLDPPSSQHHHRRRHEKHRNQQQHQQQQQLQQLNQSQQSKCHTIKVHRSRKIYLQSSCSKNHIHISGKTVRATKTQHLIDNAFYVTGIGIRGVKGHGQLVHFKGLMTGKFICYNKKGKIVAKDNGQWDISCIFREISKYNKYKYRSFYNDNWFLGFDYKGRPIRGTINRHEPQRNGSRRQHIGQHCYEFSKIKIN